MFSKNNISSLHHDPFGRRILKISKPCSGGVPDSDQSTWTFTYYVNDASGNVMATYDYERQSTYYSMKLDEQMIYGSSRLGLRKHNKLLSTFTVSGSLLEHEDYDDTLRYLGRKRYEYTNHLGNVLLVTTDRKMGIDANSDGSDDYYHAVVDAYYDYGPFGNVLDGRSGGSYRYGFNGQENQNELYGNNNATTAEYWMYDARLGRRWNVDPVVNACEGRYVAFGNNPIIFLDPLGLRPFTRTFTTQTGKKYFVDIDKDKPQEIIIYNRKIFGIRFGATKFNFYSTENDNKNSLRLLRNNTTELDQGSDDFKKMLNTEHDGTNVVKLIRQFLNDNQDIKLAIVGNHGVPDPNDFKAELMVYHGKEVHDRKVHIDPGPISTNPNAEVIDNNHYSEVAFYLYRERAAGAIADFYDRNSESNNDNHIEQDWTLERAEALKNGSDLFASPNFDTYSRYSLNNNHFPGIRLSDSGKDAVGITILFDFRNTKNETGETPTSRPSFPGPGQK